MAFTHAYMSLIFVQYGITVKTSLLTPDTHKDKSRISMEVIRWWEVMLFTCLNNHYINWILLQYVERPSTCKINRLVSGFILVYTMWDHLQHAPQNVTKCFVLSRMTSRENITWAMWRLYMALDWFTYMSNIKFTLILYRRCFQIINPN